MSLEILTGKTCLVTGATGFIGSHLCEELIRRGAKVRAIYRSDDSKLACSEKIKLNLDAEVIPKKILYGVDIIFHLAARTHAFSDTSKEDSEYFDINVGGTKKLLKAAKKANVKRFIFFSSVKAIGEENFDRLNENTSANPITAYGKSKYQAELLVLSNEYSELPTVLRLPIVYGNSEKGNLTKMIKSISENKFPPLPKIKNIRSMVHVNDVIQAAILVAEQDVSANNIYILTDGIDYSTREIYEAVCKELGKKVPSWGTPLFLLHCVAKCGDFINGIIHRRMMFDSDNLQKLVGNAFYSSAKIEKELDFIAQESFFRSLPEMIRFMKLR